MIVAIAILFALLFVALFTICILVRDIERLRLNLHRTREAVNEICERLDIHVHLDDIIKLRH